MSFMPIRGGTRGGKDQFQWDDVKSDKHRENYLGHSLMAPVGRWQKGKDLTWYNKNSKMMGQKEILRAEIAAVKKAEEDAMAAALGLKPKSMKTGSVSKQELEQVCRRQSVDEKEEEGQEERMSGLGFMKWSHRHSNQGAATGAAMFESRPVHEKESGQMRQTAAPPPPSSHPVAPSTHQSVQKKDLWVERALGLRDESSSRSKKKDKKKKRKKEKSKKKHKKDRDTGRGGGGCGRKHCGSFSESDEEEKRGHHQSERRKRRRERQEDSSSSSDEDSEREPQQSKQRKTSDSDSDSEKRKKRRREERREGRRIEERREERRREQKRHTGSEKDRRGREKERTARHRHDSLTD